MLNFDSTERRHCINNERKAELNVLTIQRPPQPTYLESQNGLIWKGSLK